MYVPDLFMAPGFIPQRTHPPAAQMRHIQTAKKSPQIFHIDMLIN
jgi:hypothetical protein